MTKQIWTYFSNNTQSYECYQKKVELKDALYHIMEDIFPCRKPF
jgi:hypothetical protein